ncbi:hypothetical protein VTK56DRAFT_3560 [Thermocarpiscus australiensis]
MAESAGTGHVVGAFTELVSQRIGSINSQLKHKMEQATVDDIVKACCHQFHRMILPDFHNNGRPWIVDYETPRDFTAFKHGRFEFSNDEILACFTPSVGMISKMMTSSVDRIRELHGTPPSHILLAGSYSKSSFLVASLWTALESSSRLANHAPPSLLQAPDSESVYVLGALSHARGC